MSHIQTSLKFKKGFGVIEVLIASTIIAVILFALVATGRAALRNSTDMQERAQALFVAQEGIELVRQMRDTNWVDGDNTTQWNTFESTDGGTVGVVHNDTVYTIQYGNGRYYLRPDSSSDESVRVGNLETFRTVKINTENGLTSLGLLPNSDIAKPDILRNAAMKVTVVVGYGSKSVTISEILTNWRPDF